MSEFIKNERITISGVLFTNPFKVSEKHGKYQAGLILNDKSLESLKAAKEKASIARFGDKNKAVTNHLWRYGEQQEYENTYEKYFIMSRDTKAIPCVLRFSDNITKQVGLEEGQIYFYPGAHVALSLEVYAAKDAKNPKNGAFIPAHVGSKPRWLLFLKDGERFTNFVDHELQDDEFGDLTSAVREEIEIPF
jgi:hypothetical protein